MNQYCRLKSFTATGVLFMTVVLNPAGNAHQRTLPDAPAAQLIAQAKSADPVPQATATMQQASTQPQSSTQQAAAATGSTLTLADAERMAIQHNPNVSIAHLLQLAQAQVTREVRSAELPSASIDLTAVGAHDNSRITAGSLNNPSVYDRAAGGLTVHQLITDFGRTHNLVRSALSNAKAQLDSERATAADITLAVDQAFYQALTAQSVLKVAQQTVTTRKATGDQISALTSSKLRSTLDLSLANVQVSQALLLVIDAQSAAESAMANLNALLGSENNDQYQLVDETPADAQSPPPNIEDLVQLALRTRSDLAALQDRSLAEKQFSAAEHDLMRPTISALAAGGLTPCARIRSTHRGTAPRL